MSTHRSSSNDTGRFRNHIHLVKMIDAHRPTTSWASVVRISKAMALGSRLLQYETRMTLDTRVFSHGSLNLSCCGAYDNIDDSPGKHGNLAKSQVEMKVDDVGRLRIVARGEVQRVTNNYMGKSYDSCR